MPMVDYDSLRAAVRAFDSLTTTRENFVSLGLEVDFHDILRQGLADICSPIISFYDTNDVYCKKQSGSFETMENHLLLEKYLEK